MNRLRPRQPASAPSSPIGPPAPTAAPDAADTTGTGAGRAPRGGLKPSRGTFNLLGLGTTYSSGGPARPDTGDSTQPLRAACSRPMNAARNDAALQRARASLASLQPPHLAAATSTAVPETLSGAQNEAGFRRAVASMLGGSADSEAVANLILGAVPPAERGAAPYAPPLMLATAMRSVGVDSLDGARCLLIASTRGEHLLRTLDHDAHGNTTRTIVPMRRGEHFLPAHEQQLFRLERVLASTASGTQALGHLRHLNDKPRELEALRDSLSICSALQDKGVDLSGCTEPLEVLQHLASLPETQMDAAIGRDTDGPLQLLAKALRHAQQAGGVRSPDAGDHAAFTAWKQGGFTESGKDTAFNHTTERLHKFLTYIDRADHGPRTLGNLAGDARAWLGRVVGVGKSPLTPVRHGAQGADRGLLLQEAARYRAGLNTALEAAVENLVDELRDPGLHSSLPKRDKHLAQAAVLDLWRETGRSTIPVADVQTRANQLLRQVQPRASDIAATSLQPHLRRLARAVPGDDGRPALQVGLRALEAAGAARMRGGTSGTPADAAAIRGEIAQLRTLPRGPWQQQELFKLQQQRRQLVTVMLEDIRSIQEARVDSRPLFKLSDLKVLLRGAPREGPTVDSAHAVMSTIAHAPDESNSTFVDGTSRGLGAVGAALLGAGTGAGTPLVYPILQLEKGRRARVSIGVGNVGARMFVGTENSTAFSAGAGAGWVLPLPTQTKASVGMLVDAQVQRSTSRAEGALITALKDKPQWQEKLPQVVDFFFEQARLPAGDGPLHRAKEPGELWQRFSNRFGGDTGVAIGWSVENTENTSAQAGASVVARVATSAHTSIGPSLSARVRAEGRHFQRNAFASGVDAPVAVHDRTVAVALSASLGQSLPAVTPTGAAAAGESLVAWRSAVPWIGGTLDFDVAGSRGVARLGRTREGELSASLCHREVAFQQPQRLIEYVNLHRADWEAAIIAQDANASMTPAQAREHLDAFLAHVSALPPMDTAVHGERRLLRQPVADQINVLEARQTTLLGRGDSLAQARALTAAERTECQAIEHEVRRLLEAADSWEPSQLYSTESNTVGSTTGLSVGIRAVNQEQATVARKNALFTAKSPAG
jgi:hypothetical protein